MILCFLIFNKKKNIADIKEKKQIEDELIIYFQLFIIKFIKLFSLIIHLILIFKLKIYKLIFKISLATIFYFFL